MAILCNRNRFSDLGFVNTAMPIQRVARRGNLFGHHVHEHHGLAQLFLKLAPDREWEQPQLRNSVFDELEGYGSSGCTTIRPRSNADS